MALVTFRCRATSAIIMYARTAQCLLDIIGKPMADRGVITSEQVEDALERLQQAVERERLSGAGARDGDEPGEEHRVSLRQRAFPLIQMLRAAHKRHVDVTWGI